MKYILFLFVLGCPIFLKSEINGQTSGEIHGLIDRRSSVFKYFISLNDGFYTTNVDSNDKFYFKDLPVGIYNIKLSFQDSEYDVIEYLIISNVRVGEDSISFVNAWSYENNKNLTWRRKMIHKKDIFKSCKIAGIVDIENIKYQITGNEELDHQLSILQLGNKGEALGNEIIVLHTKSILTRYAKDFPFPDTDTIFKVHIWKHNQKRTNGHSVVADTNGFFYMDSLPSDFYNVQISWGQHTGFVFQGVILRPDSIAFVNIKNIDIYSNRPSALYDLNESIAIQRSYKWKENYLPINTNHNELLK
ncbi:MAG: hypothetical protein HC896_05995 [Bacteroidales bacterium]|nr:hypothetical protein [Bacteroidales bacterium]